MRSWKVRPSVSMVRHENGEYSFYGEVSKKVRVSQGLAKIIENLVVGVREEDLSGEERTAAQALFVELEKSNLLRSMYHNEFIGTRYEKQVEYFAEFCEDPNDMQKGLFAKRVLVIGVGGVGACVLEHLVPFGIKHFTLVDHDAVCATNLNRQVIYSPKDVRLEKVQAAKAWLLEQDPEIDVSALNGSFGEEQTLEYLSDRRFDLIVCCADKPPLHIRRQVLEYSLKTGVPCVFAGVGFTSGAVGPFLIEEESKQRYLQKILVAIDAMRCSAEIKNLSLSVSVTNSGISCFMAGDILKFFLGLEPASVNRVIDFSFEEMKPKFTS